MSNGTVGSVFNIERYAIEDGPGIRTVVFLKGCALRCLWCANPESQSFEREILLNANACVGCGRCMEVCPKRHIEHLDRLGFITTDNNCGNCDICVDACYSNARQIMGIEYSPEQLFAIIRRDAPYYQMSGGGVTFSGGEPLFQIDFIEACKRILKKENIPVLIETCGHVPLENVKRSSEVAEDIYFDVKHMDTNVHRKLTGQGNELILSNLRWLALNYSGNLSIRYPVIPGFNDSKQEIESFLGFILELQNVKDVCFLPYHRLGLPKYTGLGREYEMKSLKSISAKDLEYLKDYGKIFNLSIKI